ncbi:MAG: hypothetical protein G01um101417_374 [Parcubacteria group bacterium Gr01-1014_17]|nr:MAG: hypothetical protein G01um101417_374 [Parcubacteria group bacterium Gr01-1014_17]
MVRGRAWCLDFISHLIDTVCRCKSPHRRLAEEVRKDTIMNANEVDVTDKVRIVRGDWANQVGKVTHKIVLFPIPDEPAKALLTIQLEGFNRSVQKNNLEVEKIA